MISLKSGNFENVRNLYTSLILVQESQCKNDVDNDVHFSSGYIYLVLIYTLLIICSFE